jgi:hypothetical protein
MIAALPGEGREWHGLGRTNADLGNTHPWHRYFDRPLRTHPSSLAQIAAFLRTCRYLCDQKTRGRPDYWEPPDRFEAMQAGDCEDHAIWAWRQLYELGYQSRFVMGHCGCWHAWVHIYINGRAYLLETTQKRNTAPQVAAYWPYWSVEYAGKAGFAFYRHPAQAADDAAPMPHVATDQLWGSSRTQKR